WTRSVLSENDPRDGTAPVRVLSMAIELSGGGARQLLAVQQQERPRDKKASLANLPQCQRGITLQELLDLRNQDKDWLEEVQWYCANYRLGGSCKPQQQGFQGFCPQCQQPGQERTKNLYEVVEEFVKPVCKGHGGPGISYVEYLSLHHRIHAPSRRQVDTFVSHWWGEEFRDLVASLQRYAESQCRKRQSLARYSIVQSVAALILNGLLVYLNIGEKIKRGSEAQPFVNGTNGTEEQAIAGSGQYFFVAERKLAVVVVLMNGCLTVLVMTCMLLEALHNTRAALNWSFWICAFANNQYQLDHALSPTEPIESSSFAEALRSPGLQGVVCIIDPSCTIYRRIWCAFELFYVKCVLPKQRICLPVTLVNEKGVISEGGVSESKLLQIKTAIQTVKTQDAKASNPVDKEQIEEAMREENTTHDQLDKHLRELTSAGLDSASLRRRVPFIYFFLCPVCSLFASECIFWLIVACRGVHEEMKITVNTWQQAAAYLLLSFVTLAAIMLVCFSSIDVPGAEATVAVEGQWMDRLQDYMQNIGELQIRISLPTSRNRLQQRVAYKALVIILVLVGPGLSLAIPLLLVTTLFQQAKWPDYLDFIWQVRLLWNMVQVVYAILGLLISFSYYMLRDTRGMGILRTFLEDMLL
ncbi:unnamed protein product, partial [Effrenium voratum]